MNTLNKITDSQYLTDYLAAKIHEEETFLDLSSSLLTDQQRGEVELRKIKLQNIIDCIKGREKPQIFADEVVEQFTQWDPAPTIEALNFLLNEFFSGRYLEGNYKKEFICETVFQVTRVIDFLIRIDSARFNSQSLPNPGSSEK